MVSRFIERWLGICLHKWVQVGERRACIKCPATEEFEPDVGGWTAGQWNRIDTEKGRQDRS